jgi:hypothetical protein
MVGPHEYEVDMRAGELRSVTKPLNALEFFKMEQANDRLSFWYDHETRKMVSQPAPGAKHTHRISLAWHSIDPEFSVQLLAEAREAEELIRAGKSVYLQPGGIHASMPIEGNGPRLLPMINLYGTEFFLDLCLREFREVKNLYNRIPYDALQPDEFHFRLWYNTTTKNAVAGTFEQAKQRNDVKELILPPLDLMIRDGTKRHEEKIKSNAQQDVPIRQRKQGRIK